MLPKTSKDATSVAETQQTLGTGASQAPEKTEHTTIVNEWSKEFDLDGLFASLDNAIQSEKQHELDADME